MPNTYRIMSLKIQFFHDDFTYAKADFIVCHFPSLTVQQHWPFFLTPQHTACLSAKQLFLLMANFQAILILVLESPLQGGLPTCL